MVGLLSAAEIAEIRGAIKSVSDTFMVTPVTYYRQMGMNDANMEDNTAEAFKIYSFKVLVEFITGTEESQMKKFNEGSFDFGDITLTANIEDLDDIDFMDDQWMPKNRIETDYFLCMGKLYKVLDTALDGPLEQKQVLVMMSGELYTKVKTFTNIVT